MVMDHLATFGTTLSNISLKNNTRMAYTTIRTQITQNGTADIYPLTPTLSPPVVYTFTIILTILLILALVGNITLLSLIIFVRKLHSVSHIFLANLLVCDLLVAVLVMPFDVDQFINGQKFRHDIITCELSTTVFLLSLPASALSLCLLTGERFVTLTFPLSRDGLVTRKKITCSLVCTWLYVIIMSTLPAMGWKDNPTNVKMGECLFFFTTDYAILTVTVNFLLPLLIILALNINIFCIANKSAQRLAVPFRSTQAKGRGTSFSLGANMKAAKRILLLVGLFLLSWLPYILSISVNIYCKGCVPRTIIWATNILNYSSAATNPILYGLLNRQIRFEMRKVVRIAMAKCKGKDLMEVNRNSTINTIECTTLFSTNTPEYARKHPEAENAC